MNKKIRKDNYKKTLLNMRQDLSGPEIIISKIIHSNHIEKVLDWLNKTLLRPRSLLIGSILSFICILFVYTLMKNSYYVINGFEIIISFTVGWIIGIIVDLIVYLFTKK